ncbi:MAG: hypothetical protein MUF87_11965 [Anaerolineae bacterium]|jgi:DNA (cytosine-5)-methyltransferase 1|nr:hypothetical protein [Anaerolineae bacterium]
MSQATEILNHAYKAALSLHEMILNQQQHADVITLVEAAETQKAVLTVLITSLTKKIDTPTQDIRQHKVELENGYSGRVYDTRYITPFIREKFRRIHMKESGWLTRSLEQAHAFTLDFPGKIANLNVKSAFLRILDDVEIKQASPTAYLITVFAELNALMKRNELLTSQTKFQTEKVAINAIIEALQAHFSFRYRVKGASRLPVLALYSIYQQLMDTQRYRGKRLAPLKSHTASDLKSTTIGDIEVLNGDNSFFEALEIKAGHPITHTFIEDAFEKFQTFPVQRYYLLTTHEPNTLVPETLIPLITHISQVHGCELIINGVIPTLKYYLRLLENPMDFLLQYQQNLAEDADVKQPHLEKWVMLQAKL